jgi:hypothetical protein
MLCRGCDERIDVGASTRGFCARCAEEVAWMRNGGRHSSSLLSSLLAQFKCPDERRPAPAMYRARTYL